MKPKESAPPAPHSSMDDVIEVYKRDIDRTLLRENLKLTPEERLRNLERLQRFAAELRRAMRAARVSPSDEVTLPFE